MGHLSSVFSFAISVVACICVADSATAERPNVIFILADDLGIGDLHCYGNADVDTPSIDALADSGMRFTDHYAPSPLCAPSRAAYLTGRFNHRTGAVDVPSNRGLDRIALSQKTFGDYFREAGYATALIGKWHNGLYCRDYLPHRRGFDLFCGYPNGGMDYWKWHLQRNDDAVFHDGRFLSKALTDEAIEFVRKNHTAEKPFCLFFSHPVPHPPFQAPQALVDKYERRLGDKVSRTVAVIYAMIEAMDRDIGRLLAMLRDEGLREDTIVVFTSDNGAYLGGSGSRSTRRFHAGLSGNKGDVGEQGIRVPAIVSWPGQIPAARVSDLPVHGCDWLPTLLNATGGGGFPRPPFDGVDIMPLLRGKPMRLLDDRRLPFQKNRYRPAAHSDAAVRRGRWKLVWPPVPVTMSKASARDNPSYLRGIERPHWEMPLDRELAAVPEFDDPQPRLFNLSTDAAEQHDVAKDHPEVVAELSRYYDDWFNDVIADWNTSRRQILRHDEAYWKDRQPPDAAELFQDFWLWNKAGPDVDPRTADPLSVFRGFWTNP